MTKLFALIAAFGLVAAPAFAIEEHKGAAPAAAKTEVAKEMKAEDCSKITDIKAKDECMAQAEKAKAAPAAGGEMKTETPAKH